MLILKYLSDRRPAQIVLSPLSRLQSKKNTHALSPQTPTVMRKLSPWVFTTHGYGLICFFLPATSQF